MAEDLILALGGGGALGAYQCGAYKALAPYLRSGAYRLRAVTGASVGAINAGVIVRHYEGPDRGVAALERFWRSLELPALPFIPAPVKDWQAWNGLLTGLVLGNPRLYHPHPLGWTPLGAMFPALFPLYDNSPLVSTMHVEVGDYRSVESPLLAVQAIELTSGEPRLFDSDSAPVTAHHYAASASVPFLMGVREIEGHHYWDGDFTPDTLLPALLRLLHRRSERLSGQRCRIIHINLYSRSSRLPLTLHEHIWRLKSLFFGGRIDAGHAATEAMTAHLDFVEAAEQSARRLADSPLKRLVTDEAARLKARRQLHVDITHLVRSELPDDPVSSIFDYSPKRLAELRAQGETEAAAVFARELASPARAERATSRRAARSE